MAEILDEEAAALEALLPELVRRLFRQAEGHPTEELPLAQVRVCDLLVDGAHSVSCIASRLGVSASSITQLADRLERAGLVERMPEADDRRVRNLCLTDHGQEWMRNRADARRMRVRRALERLTRTERDTVMAGVSMLLSASAERVDEGTGTGRCKNRGEAE